jgi:hypothetical protein
MTDRRDQTLAGQYRRAAHEAELKGRPVTALLFRNAAWLEENGWDYLRCLNDEPQDTTVKGPDDV